MRHDRVLPLDGVHNFRDYGGYAVAGGGRVRQGLLWRSAEHGDASDSDLAAIAGLGLTTVIDLRGASERAAKPCRRPEGFAAQVLFYDGETAGLALHSEAAGEAIDAETARQAMLRLYEGIAFRDSLAGMIRQYFAALAKRDGASLVHCVAGKDRTGFAVAMLHHLLGVSREDMIEDYLMTNTAGHMERRVAGVMSAPSRFSSLDETAIRMLLSVRREYLDAAFAAIERECVSVDRYQRDVLGLDTSLRDSLRRRFIEQ